LPQSVPSPSEVQATYAATLFDDGSGWDFATCCLSWFSLDAARSGVRQSSRTTLHVRMTNEAPDSLRSACSRHARARSAIVVTSGTAAAELHACVAEASQAFVPLLVLTADRPRTSRCRRAQTIDQHELFGEMVRRFEIPACARRRRVNVARLAQRLWPVRRRRRRATESGPVHLNAAFVEPLVVKRANSRRPHPRRRRQSLTRVR